MFEALISHVHSGRVERELFATREGAERYLADTEERLVNPPKKWSARRQMWVEQKPKSLRDYRLEIHFREDAVILKAEPKARRRRKVAA